MKRLYRVNVRIVVDTVVYVAETSVWEAEQVANGIPLAYFESPACRGHEIRQSILRAATADPAAATFETVTDDRWRWRECFVSGFGGPSIPGDRCDEILALAEAQDQPEVEP